ncbi:Protein kinase, putative [Hondaea fermentalgiana]|uniref:Protein kinase, putative n=1 Tax=Hondaea fermentalgiana TaxID=2315210 RepID=A0A2R5GPS2_9STRA|nr:Protein kinase, putative [Hondaea fermentalgiana]|eukprot:GBG30341.1 Protein kinase, putative [Hondaea fermentalgiana]
MADAAGTFAVVAVAALLSARARFHSPRLLVNRHVFKSEHFSDKDILLQLVDAKYQTKLEAHNWDRLYEIGPCFATLAEAMLCGRSLAEAVRADTRIGDELRQKLLANIPALARAMCEIAESYLCRSLPKSKGSKGAASSSRDKKASKQVPRVVLRGQRTGRRYRPVQFLNRGSAGVVYSAIRVDEDPNANRMANALQRAMQNAEATTTAEPRDNRLQGFGQRLRGAISMQLERQLVLKQIEPTQRSSAINEYRIASTLAENDEHQTCVTYLDRLDESNERLWLLLRRVTPSPYGVDLAEYIEHQFFEIGDTANQGIAQLTVLQLLRGMDYISTQGVIMRDVKPDNVLIDYHLDLANNPHAMSRWSDFGLSIDIGRMSDGSGLRSPLTVHELGEAASTSDDPIKDSLVAFWYDTQKLVPKPKWVGRRPPENCFQDPTRVHISSYDLYMMGIITVSMALGIDIPHIHKNDVKAAFESKTGIGLPDDYLTSFELGQSIREESENYLPHFQHSFGDEFGAALLRETEQMLRHDPRERPRPIECHGRLATLSPAFQRALVPEQ